MTKIVQKFKERKKVNVWGLGVGEWESGLVIIRSNATSTSYFTTFLQNVDVANLLLVFI